MPKKQPETPLPKQIHVYKGPLTDSLRWAGFEHRAGDIFVCTPPKCGTTWMQAICALLIFQTPNLKVNPAAISPWLDSILNPIEDDLDLLKGQTHRRIIKTHTPLDGIPYFEDCHYIGVYRDPRDVFFSLRSHVANMKFDIGTEMLENSPEDGFRTWLATEYQAGDEQGPSLGAMAFHLNSFRVYEDLPNIDLYHYSDLLRDLSKEMWRLAANLAIEVDRKTMPQLVEAAGFSNMKKNAERFAPGVEQGAWRDTGSFFNKGTSGQWRDVITPDDNARFLEELNRLLPPEAANWLLDGNSSAGRSGREEINE